MDSRVSKFKNYIEEQGMSLDPIRTNVSTYFEFVETIKDGPRIRVVADFPDNQTSTASVLLLDYVKINNPNKKEYIYELLNELNTKYFYHKFTMDQAGNILISINIPFGGQYDPSTTFSMIVLAIQNAENEYSRFMKLQWS